MSGIAAFLHNKGTEDKNKASHQQRGGYQKRTNERTNYRGGGRRNTPFNKSFDRHSDRPKKDRYADVQDYEERETFVSADDELSSKLVHENVSELFNPIEHEYDMFIKTKLNWLEDSTSITEKTTDAEQLKTLRGYDEKVIEQTKALMRQVVKPKGEGDIQVINAQNNPDVSSAFRDAIKNVQDEVSSGASKHYSKMDKNILHYEEIFFALAKSPKINHFHHVKKEETSNQVISNEPEKELKEFIHVFDKERIEDEEIKNFSNFADDLISKCTELYNMAEDAPVCDVTSDEDVQQSIQHIIDTTKKNSNYKKFNGPHDFGTLYTALLDCMGRKNEQDAPKKEQTKRKRVQESDDEDSDSDEEPSGKKKKDNGSDDEDEKSQVTPQKSAVEILGDRYGLLSEIKKWEVYLNKSLGVTGIDLPYNSNKNKYKLKQIRKSMSLAIKPEWKEKESNEVATLASSSLPIYKSIRGNNSKCTEIVDSLLYQ